MLTPQADRDSVDDQCLGQLQDQHSGQRLCNKIAEEEREKTVFHSVFVLHILLFEAPEAEVEHNDIKTNNNLSN